MSSLALPDSWMAGWPTEPIQQYIIGARSAQYSLARNRQAHVSKINVYCTEIGAILEISYDHTFRRKFFSFDQRLLYGILEISYKFFSFIPLQKIIY